MASGYCQRCRRRLGPVVENRGSYTMAASLGGSLGTSYGGSVAGAIADQEVSRFELKLCIMAPAGS